MLCKLQQNGNKLRDQDNDQIKSPKKTSADVWVEYTRRGAKNKPERDGKSHRRQEGSREAPGRPANRFSVLDMEDGNEDETGAATSVQDQQQTTSEDTGVSLEETEVQDEQNSELRSNGLQSQ